MALMVGESSVDRTRRAWECFERRDPEGLIELCAPDVEFTTYVAEMEGRVYRGPEGVREWFANVDETFDSFSPEVVRMEALDDRFVLTEVLIRARIGNLSLEERAFQLVEDDGGRARRWTWHRSRDEALAAAAEGER